MPTIKRTAGNQEGLFGGELSSQERPPKYRLNRSRCSQWYERRGRRAGFRLIAGTDEAGRGALFGPVVAAAVILDPATRIRGIRDSKQLTSKARERLGEVIRRQATAWAIARVEPGDIDRINIYQASRMAMRLAVLALHPAPDLVLVDALRLDLQQPQIPIIHGDALSLSIAAASILAKVERDRLLVEWDRMYPGYELARNKGYGTAAHQAGLRDLGPTPLHRYTYAPVAQAVRGAGPGPEPLLYQGMIEID